MTLANTLRALNEFPHTLEKYLDDVPHSALNFRPPSWEGIPSERLSIRQQVCHVRDIEIDGYHLRFSRLLREKEPNLPSIDTYDLVTARNYDTADLANAFNAFVQARATTVTLLDRLSQDDLKRSGTFEDYGRVTLKSMIHYLVSHDQQHLAGIQWLLGQHDATL